MGAGRHGQLYEVLNLVPWAWGGGCVYDMLRFTMPCSAVSLPEFLVSPLNTLFSPHSSVKRVFVYGDAIKILPWASSVMISCLQPCHWGYYKAVVRLPPTFISRHPDFTSYPQSSQGEMPYRLCSSWGFTPFCFLELFHLVSFPESAIALSLKVFYTWMFTPSLMFQGTRLYHLLPVSVQCRSWFLNSVEGYAILVKPLLPLPLPASETSLPFEG